jgi:Skp family chaperone for outer membrane proteins
MIRRSVFVAFLAVAATLTAQGQNTGSTRIALVSLQETITRTQEGQKRTQELRAKYKPAEDNIKTKQAEIGRLQNQLAEGSNIMSDAAKRKLQRSIETKRREAQRAVEDAEAAFQKEVQALQQDLYSKVRVIIRDYMIEKDRLFAELTLDADELALYRQVYRRIAGEAVMPDLVIYLQAPVDVLIRRITARGIAYEEDMDPRYLDRVAAAYTHFFHHYEAAPLVIVNAAEIDFAHGDADYEHLFGMVRSISKGRHYLNPLPL